MTAFPNYVYLTIKADLSSSSNLKLVKKNVCNSSCDLFWFKPNHYPSEPTFIPRPNAVEEDDGILVDIILDGEKGKSYVAIFDAQTMKVVNKAYLPTCSFCVSWTILSIL